MNPLWGAELHLPALASGFVHYPAGPDHIAYSGAGLARYAPERINPSMKKFVFAVAPLTLILALALMGCGKQAADGGPGASSGGTSGSGSSCATSQTIDLGQVNFAQTCVTVSANQAVTFNDPSATGGVHIICTGQNAACNTQAGAPKDLSTPGFQIQPGQQKQVTFTTAGTYKLACTVHPAMNMTVIVK